MLRKDFVISPRKISRTDRFVRGLKNSRFQCAGIRYIIVRQINFWGVPRPNNYNLCALTHR